MIPRLLVMTLVVVGSARVDGPPEDDGPPPTPVVEFRVRPAVAPVPALKYRLAWSRREQVPGNAAVFYHRAILMLKDRAAPAGEKRPGMHDPMAVARWLEGPIGDLPVDEARSVLQGVDRILSEIEQGSRRADCDWGFDGRPEGYELLLPEIQETRSLARLVALRGRLAIREGRFDDALAWLRVGMTLGRHAAEGPSVIQGLVGVAIDMVMTNACADLVRTPGSPSLYWALADRPRPMIDLRRAIESESHFLERELPAVARLEEGPWSEAEARALAGEIARKFSPLLAGESVPVIRGAIPTQLPEFGTRLGMAAAAAKAYPAARVRLIASGTAEAVVDAMPVLQVAMLDTVRNYRQRRDDELKWLGIPYAQSFDKFDSAASFSVEEKLENPLLALMSLLTPALSQVRLAGVRLERQLDALQAIEAVRLHAGGHDGQLPSSLEAIAESPVPPDPFTGKPFGYRVEGGDALLWGPFPRGGPAHPSYAVHDRLILDK